MSLILWIILYAVQSLFWKWILSWGGAQWLAGWKSFFLIDWFTLDWSPEQIRLYALVIWVLTTIGFLIGLFFPAFRRFA